MSSSILHSPKLLFRYCFLSVVVLLTCLLPQAAAAQSDNRDIILDGWSAPVNLSQAGAATRPYSIVDATGQMHLVWHDEFASLQYMRLSPQRRTDPRAIEVPFEMFEPVFAVDRNNVIHVAWRDDVNRVWYSAVSAEQFGERSAWLRSQQVTAHAADVSIAVDAADGVHFAWVRRADADGIAAGVYYQTIEAVGNEAPIVVRESPYFRGLDPLLADLTLTFNGMQRWLVWSNPNQDQVFYAQSADGTTWTPQLLDQRDDEDSAISHPPLRPRVYAQGDDVVLTWQAGHSVVACGEFFVQSADRGATFSARTPIGGDLLECPFNRLMIATGDDGLVQITGTNDSTWTAIWQAGEWMTREAHGALTRFTDPVSRRDVVAGCHQAGMLGDTLVVVFCDEGTGEDIWMTQRPIGTLISAEDQPVLSAEAAQVPPTPEPDTSQPTPLEATEPPSAPDRTNMIVLGVFAVGILIAGIGVASRLRAK